MKKLKLLLGALCLLLPIFASADDCNQHFYRTLRYGKEYSFVDSYNANSSDKWVRSYQYQYTERGDYNKSTYFPEFDRTPDIRASHWKIAKNT